MPLLTHSVYLKRKVRSLIMDLNDRPPCFSRYITIAITCLSAYYGIARRYSTCEHLVGIGNKPHLMTSSILISNRGTRASVYQLRIMQSFSRLGHLTASSFLVVFQFSIFLFNLNLEHRFQSSVRKYPIWQCNSLLNFVLGGINNDQSQNVGNSNLKMVQRARKVAWNCHPQTKYP